MKFVANKSFKYATRQLRAGDEFSPDARHAKILALTGLADPARDAAEELGELRKDAAMLGIAVDNRWGARRLRAEITHRMGA